jgi:two-component system, sensor histidine kinase and response regulator
VSIADDNKLRDATRRPVRLHLLVAEDHTINQMVITALLEALGHQVDIVADGRQAVAAVGRGTYDLVLMDMMMPEMDGPSAARAIRALPAPLGDIPIVALTASTDRADVLRCRAAGMNDFLAKPITTAALARTIEAVLAGNAAATPDRKNLLAGDRDQAFDRAALDQFIADIGADLARSLLPKMRAEMAQRLVALRALATAADREPIRREAHSLKGSAATIGLRRLSQQAMTLEKNAETMNVETLIAAIVAIETAFAEGWSQLDRAS